MVLARIYLFYPCIADKNKGINMALILILGPRAQRLFCMFPSETSGIRNSFDTTLVPNVTLSSIFSALLQTVHTVHLAQPRA